MKFIRTIAPSGEFVSLANDQWVGQSMRMYGEWSHGEMDFFAQILLPRDNVVEVGANIGTHTVFLARDLCPQGRVYAFEPRRIIFQVLCSNLILNEVTNVEAFPLAVGQKPDSFREGSIPLDMPTNAGAFSLGAIGGDGEVINVVSLDSMLSNIGKTRLLKVDVEGFELEVLKGSKALIDRDRPLLYVENDRIEKSEDLMRHINSLKYKMYWHLVPLFRENNFLRCSANAFGPVASFNLICIPNEMQFDIAGSAPITDFAAHPLKQSD